MAGLLIYDVAEIGWIRTVLNKVFNIAVFIHWRRKLKVQIAECIEEYNALLNNSIQRKIKNLRKNTVGSSEAKMFEAELQSMKSWYITAVMIEKCQILAL